MTYFGFLFLVAGIIDNLIISIFLAALIVVLPFCWRFFAYPIVRENIARKLSEGNIIEEGICQCCGGKALIAKRVLEWNKGYMVQECVGNCRRRVEGFVKLNIG
jgi:hypothetical protein